MEKILKRMWFTVLTILAVWVILTIWVNAKGKSSMLTFGNTAAGRQVLIVYDPDPLYNLDEKVCKTFAQGLASGNTGITIATVAAAEKLADTVYTLYVFCANTYNWQPDRAISNYIKNQQRLKNRPVVAITLGAGSTAAAQKTLEQLIHEKEAILVDSRHFWLMRPNDETKLKEKNVAVALSKVQDWAKEITKRIQQW